jgi:hypothetical protein
MGGWMDEDGMGWRRSPVHVRVRTGIRMGMDMGMDT